MERNLKVGDYQFIKVSVTVLMDEIKLTHLIDGTNKLEANDALIRECISQLDDALLALKSYNFGLVQ